ncbi:AfsR/SARP family transcriptional regulator [Saccharothrix longispora]|uniref:AfsR/SARP family transcriptional regulator n=1 Tax=Saccharothrix longispora TaxID=33920 RepID=UPI0028FD21F5|nr:BTAD domain-containing putative transcriptional regulator [Saccharothrix longispora]MDU0289722.1 BTAD domain-containing putative transcriptional regulator [Saccharothrix longispora]
MTDTPRQAVAVEFRILGPVEVSVRGSRRALGGARQQRLLALLLLHAGETVTGDAVVDALWDSDPPDTARRQVHNAIAALRRALGDAKSLLVTDSAGYRIERSGARIDAEEFQAAVDAATRRRDCGDLDGAVESLTTALEQWRGPALDGLNSTVLAGAAARLDEQRLLAHLLLVDCRLDRGEAAALVPELNELVAAHPLHEGVHRRLMLALYRAGRQADALAAYDRVRLVFSDELGLEPGSDLQDLHQRILRAEAAPAPSGTALDAAPAPSGTPLGAAPAPMTLPYTVADFTGRAAEVTTLIRQGGSQATRPGMAITVLSGMAGVGKTTLALRAAHSVAADYPDGSLFLDLQGHTPGAHPLDPDAALDILLRTLGVPPEHIPEPGPLRVGRWRSQVADRRLLLVLDNVRDAAQIRPLIPGGADAWVVATSRRSLTTLEGATTVAVDVLPPREAEALFRQVAGEDRVFGEEELLRVVVDLCGRLPLALRIAAARLRGGPRWTVGKLVERLRGQRRRLTELAVDDLSVQAAFALSYEELDGAARSAFRRLGVHPGAHFGLHAAAALLGVGSAAAEDALERLVAASLLSEEVPGRYRLHDLLRDYARDLVDREEPGERAAAWGRLTDYYLALGRACEALLDPGLELAEPGLEWPVELPRLGTAEDVRAVMAVEHRNFVALVAAGESAPTARSAVLATTLGVCLLRHGHAGDAVGVFRRGLAAAAARGRPGEQAALHRHLGLAHLALGRFDEAVGELERGLVVAGGLGDPLAEGRLLGNLAIVRMRQGDDAAAEEHLRRAWALLHEDGAARDRAAVLGNLGLVLTRTGRYAEAAAHHHQALAISVELGNQRLEGSNLINVGWNALLSGDAAAAREHLTRSLKLAREIGARGDEARSLSLLAECLLAAGESDGALVHGRAALAVARQIANPDVEGRALDVLGRVHEERGEPDRAEECFRALLEVAATTGQEFRATLARDGLRRLRG